uniref:thioredoxin-dependent peroxiredoxin n=1 Tax=Globodera pallida TaxID=36090 RepID=A0A183C1I0_GLOPA
MSAGRAHIGKPAPDFTVEAVVDHDFQTISLSDFKGKYVVLIFYPEDFSFVCPTEITAFSDRSDEFANINTQLLACSTDSKFCHFEWISKPRKQGGLGEMKIPVLADRNQRISRDYGVLKEETGSAFRGFFIIDTEGILRQITINDFVVGRCIDETLRLVQAFQFTDEHGEVCPVNWRPGQKTIKPDCKKSKENFDQD